MTTPKVGAPQTGALNPARLALPRPRARAAAALGVAMALALAGCSSNKGPSHQGPTALAVLKALVKPKHEKAKPVTLTRAQVRKVKAPLMQADLPARNARAYMVAIGNNGPVTTWATPDGISVSLNHGLVVATRGLGNDLMSMAPPPVAQLARGAGSVQATYYFLNGLDQTWALPVTCELRDQGRESVVITELRYTLRHISATCTGGRVSFTNDYWFDSHGEPRQSRQWISPLVGYMSLADLKE